MSVQTLTHTTKSIPPTLSTREYRLAVVERVRVERLSQAIAVTLPPTDRQAFYAFVQDAQPTSTDLRSLYLESKSI